MVITLVLGAAVAYLFFLEGPQNWHYITFSTTEGMTSRLLGLAENLL